MGSVYHPRHQVQLGRGTPVPGATQGSMDCGPRSVQMGIDQVTRGQLRPTIAEIRRRMGKSGARTTSLFDADRCVESYGYQEMRTKQRRALTYYRFTGLHYKDILTDAVKSGESVQLALDYGAFNRAMRFFRGRTGDPNYGDGHSVVVHGWKNTRGRVYWQLFDPLDDGRSKGIPKGPRWVPAQALLMGMRAFPGFQFGIFRGGERTL